MVIDVVFEWFLADSVPGTEKRLFLFVVDGEGEHSAQMVQTFFPIFVVEVRE